MPLSSACNPYLPNTGIDRFAGSCELTRLALAVWYARPDAYAAYWESLLAVAPQVDFQAFIAEKIGYSRPIDYEAWRALNGYSELDVRGLYDLEQHYLDIVSKRTLQEICERRIREIRKDLGKYVQEP